MNININKLKARIDEEIYICRAYQKSMENCENATHRDYEIERVEQKIGILDSLLDLVYEAQEK